jgi:quercetin dioxygenase-like cupin family protein
MSKQHHGRRAGVVLATTAALSLVPTVAYATPPGPGVTGRILWQETVGNTDLVLREITLPAGQSTGWHYHRGTLYATVERGTLSHFNSECRPDGLYHAGQFLTEPSGPQHVHIGRNLGATDVVLDVLYVNPKGSQLSEDAANPGCDFQ